jgi:hypothetical protein
MNKSIVNETADRTVPAGDSLRVISTSALGVFVIAVIVYAIAVYLFVPRGSEIDELGLFNPVYMKLHFGRMTYPVYGHFQAMFVHPPVRYSEVAALMRAGLTLPYAEGFMPCFLTIGIALAIAQARFSRGSKLCLLFGFFAGLVWLTVIDEPLTTLRPDEQLALAWFFGLILLQDAYMRGWNLPRLFLGSFAITYASGLHYYGVAAFLGVGYYVWKVRREFAGIPLRRALTAIVGGGCLFGVPYLLFFVLPSWRDILQFTAAVQSSGNWLSPVTKHYAQYGVWNSIYLPAAAYKMPVYALLHPPLDFKIPLFLAGAALLALRRDLRGLAVASLPLTFFVFVYSQGKSAGYYLPELMIYFAGISVLFWSALEIIGKRVAPRFAQAAAALLFVAGACWGTQAGYQVYQPYLNSRAVLIAPMDIMRACARRLVGPNALIGGRLGLWYVSGGQSWYEVAPDLLWKSDISDISLPAYFSKFDYVVENSHMSNTTINSSLESLPSWYVSGILKLHGFVFNDQHNITDFLVFKTSPASKITGYVVDEQKVYYFNQDPAGNFVFGSRVCPFETWPAANKFNLPHFNAIYLPKAPRTDPARSFLPAAGANDPQSAVATFVMPAQDFEARHDAFDADCRVLDTARGSLTEVNLKELLDSQKQDRPMHFLKNIEEAEAHQFDSNTVAAPMFDLDHMVPAYDKAHIETRNQVKVVTTSRERYSFAAVIAMPDLRFPQPSWVAVRLRITKGQIGVGILDKDKNDFSSRTFIDGGDGSETVYLKLKPTPGPKEFVIENGDYVGGSAVEIESVRVISGAG